MHRATVVGASVHIPTLCTQVIPMDAIRTVPAMWDHPMSEVGIIIIHWYHQCHLLEIVWLNIKHTSRITHINHQAKTP